MDLKRKEIPGFNFLRAIMSILIVVWHTGGFGHSLIFDPNNIDNHVFTLSDFLNFHILMVIVPLFIFISCFLIVYKKPSKDNMIKRSIELVILTVFWTILLTIWQGGYKAIWTLVPRDFVSLTLIFIRSGNTIYYFFVSLIICNILTFYACKISFRTNVILLIVCVLVLIAVPLIAIRFNEPIIAAFYNPLNFIIYAFAAVVIYTLIVERKIKKNVLYFILLAGAIVFSVWEWKFLKSVIFIRFQGFGIPAYTRVSLLFISAFFIVFFYHFTPKRNSKVINYLARNSLALYCLHPFLLSIRLGERFGLEGLPLRIVNIAIIVLLCNVIADFLRSKILKKELIH
jgi:hypothetical protein